MLPVTISLLLSLATFVSYAASITDFPPTAKIRNGSYTGIHNTEYEQNFFLGIPYARQPVGNLRFTVPHSLTETWNGSRDAKEYSDICVGYDELTNKFQTDQIWYPQSEACLTLNVVRPSSVSPDAKLPVGVWIHGGGFYEGSGRDQRYNMSRIVQNASKRGKPFIGITLNYRLSTWGFISSCEVSGTGNTNLGFRDQRMALQWIQENIDAFGGDPDKVAIWGESAGAMSVGYHLIAYGGRDDRLFRAAIMESGGSINANPSNYTAFQSYYDQIVKQTNFSNVVDTLQCLRETPFTKLNDILNTTAGSPAFSFTPMVDGDLLRNWGSVQLQNHEFVKVPILAGTNTDEGSSWGPTGINSTQQWYDCLTSGGFNFRTPSTIAYQIVKLYPDDPKQGTPEFLGDKRVPYMGYEWRRVCAFAGDFIMHANRRRQCEAWAETSTPAYCYRFNARSTENAPTYGVTRMEEIAFVFNNIDGLGYHYGKPFDGAPQSYIHLSYDMASRWASFIHDLDPNTAFGNASVNWDVYDKNAPADPFLDANTTGIQMEADTWRKDAIDYTNSVPRAFWR